MAREKAAESRFWDSFIDLARREGVQERALCWYVHHLEYYLRALPVVFHAMNDIRSLCETSI
jgi:hypothetical protein